MPRSLVLTAAWTSCARRSLVLSFALSASSAAQTSETWDDGPLIGLPVACFVNGLGSTPPPGQIHSKKAGFMAAAARTMPPASGPDLRFARMFRDRPGPTPRPGFRIDAFSIGLDFLWIDESTGILQPPDESWTGMLLSFRPENPMSRTTSGILRREDERDDRAGTDVFDFVFDLPSMTTGLYRDMDGTEIGFSDGTPASAQGQITALDLHLTAWDLDPGTVSRLPTNPRVFFSVPTAAVGAVPEAWWPPAARSGATILFTEWNGSDWTEPRVFATPAALSLDGDDDVDALAVEWNGTSAEIVFSTQPVLGRNQLLFVRPGTDGDPQPVRVDSTTTVTESAGAGSADVAAVCFYDPGISGQGCSQVMLWSYVLGTPTEFARPPVFPVGLANTTTRGCTATDEPAIVCSGAGWPASGRGTGFGVLYLTGGTETPPPIDVGFANWPLALPFLRPGSGMGGDPMSIALPLPDYLWAPDPLRCTYLWSFWFAIDASLSSYAISRPVRIRL